MLKRPCERHVSIPVKKHGFAGLTALGKGCLDPCRDV
jgi:hypothetical protein